jgi:hypothetical protein
MQDVEVDLRERRHPVQVGQALGGDLPRAEVDFIYIPSSELYLGSTIIG